MWNVKSFSFKLKGREVRCVTTVKENIGFWIFGNDEQNDLLFGGLGGLA